MKVLIDKIEFADTDGRNRVIVDIVIREVPKFRINLFTNGLPPLELTVDQARVLHLALDRMLSGR